MYLVDHPLNFFGYGKLQFRRFPNISDDFENFKNLCAGCDRALYGQYRHLPYSYGEIGTVIRALTILSYAYRVLKVSSMVACAAPFVNISYLDDVVNR